MAPLAACRIASWQRGGSQTARSTRAKCLQSARYLAPSSVKREARARAPASASHSISASVGWWRGSPVFVEFPFGADAMCAISVVVGRALVARPATQIRLIRPPSRSRSCPGGGEQIRSSVDVPAMRRAAMAAAWARWAFGMPTADVAERVTPRPY